METESTFWDHSQPFVWEWFWQSLINKYVSFYYDYKKKCYCRKVSHVKGEVRFDINDWRKTFYPYPNRIVNYKQLL